MAGGRGSPYYSPYICLLEIFYNNFKCLLTKQVEHNPQWMTSDNFLLNLSTLGNSKQRPAGCVFVCVHMWAHKGFRVVQQHIKEQPGELVKQLYWLSRSGVGSVNQHLTRPQEAQMLLIHGSHPEKLCLSEQESQSLNAHVPSQGLSEHGQEFFCVFWVRARSPLAQPAALPPTSAPAPLHRPCCLSLGPWNITFCWIHDCVVKQGGHAPSYPCKTNSRKLPSGTGASQEVPGT